MFLYFFFLISYFIDITEKDDRESAKKSNQPKFISEADIKENEKNNWSGSATNVKEQIEFLFLFFNLTPHE